MKLKRGTKFGEELTCLLKIGIRNLANFDLKVKDFHLNGLFMNKVYIV